MPISYGFNLGAEDYVTKPFNIEILHKKINVILKRNTKNTFYKDDHLFFDKNTSKLVIDNKEIKLTPLEFKLLSLFLENQNQIILKETIIEKIWDSNENYVDEHTLLVNISRLPNMHMTSEELMESKKSARTIVLLEGCIILGC